MFDPDAHMPRINRGMVYLGACLIAGIRLARERQVNVRVVPTSRAVEESAIWLTRFTTECSERVSVRFSHGRCWNGSGQVLADSELHFTMLFSSVVDLRSAHTRRRCASQTIRAATGTHQYAESSLQCHCPRNLGIDQQRLTHPNARNQVRPHQTGSGLEVGFGR